MDKLALTISALRIAYDRHFVLEVPHFRLATGERCLITGPSGSGKTVFLSVLLGQAPRGRVLSGRFQVEVNGATADLDYRAYRSQQWLADNTAVVFQDAMHSLHPYRAIETQCPAQPADYAALNLDPDYFLSQAYRTGWARAGEAVAAGSPRFTGDCSGGERQRISLLFPFVQHQRCLLVLDEPLTDIDRISEQSVRAAMEPLLADPSRAIVLVTHQTDWLTPHSMRHYRLEESVGTGPRRLLEQGLGPPPRVAVPTAPPVPPAAHPGADEAIFRLRITRPYRLAADSGFRLWPITALELRPGESVGLIGESGSGKSSLLRAVAGLFPRRDYRDVIDLRLRLDGAGLEPLMGVSPRRRYGRVQYVSQDSTGSLIAAERVDRHLDWIRRHKGVPHEAFWPRVDEWAGSLRLYADEATRTGFLGLSHQSLSMGQKRRYGLLRAFLLLDIYDEPDDASAGGAADPARPAPKLLLLDEISRGLDRPALDGLVGVLRRFCSAYNVAMLVVSHDMDFIRRICPTLRMVFNGALLPSSIRCDDLAVLTPDGDMADPGLNPYYHLFLASEDLAPSLRVAPEERGAIPIDQYAGCLLRRYIRCPAQQRGAAACVHQALQRVEPRGAVGICQ